MRATRRGDPSRTSHPLPAADPLARVLDALQTEEGRTTGSFKGFRLGSAFQPIFSVAHRRVVGHEALLRATVDGAPVAPPQVFACADEEAEVVHLDRLCRAVHLGNFSARLRALDGWLFLNVDPRVVIPGPRYGAFFSEVLEQFDLPTHRVVVEILEGAIGDSGLLAEAVSYYREIGCLVAIDDFGAGHSNFDRVWRLAPDLVKLDRSVVAEAVANPRARRMLPNLVSLVHEAGCLALIEGVENRDEALLALDSEADLVQGYLFGRPAAAEQLAREEIGTLSDALCRDFRDHHRDLEEQRRRHLSAYLTAFQHAAASLQSGAPLDSAAFKLLTKPSVRRCFILDRGGRQLGDSVGPRHLPAGGDRRFAPLANARESAWFRRGYFRRALAAPGEPHISRPYLSLTGVHLCVTLSMAIDNDGEQQVFCCDLDWESFLQQ